MGPQTSQEARDAGFETVRNADGDAVTLAQAVMGWAETGKGALLHVTGAHGDSKLAAMLTQRGFAVRQAVLYDVVAATALPWDAREALEKNAIGAALFFSPRSARVFCELAGDALLGGVTAVAISPVTAQALEGRGFGAIRIAAAPNQDALLAVLAGL